MRFVGLRLFHNVILSADGRVDRALQKAYFITRCIKMIELYSGTPGSGKSLHAAETIYWRLRKGAPVICNFYIEPGYIKKYKNTFYYCPNDELTPEVLYEFSKTYFSESGNKFKEDSILLVIDECQLLFNARSWGNTDRAGWLSFFTQHRKYGYLIILVAQNDRMLDRQVRSLIEYETIHRKVSNFGFFGAFIKTLAHKEVFLAVKRWYPIKERVDFHMFVARKRYYSLYDTRALFDYEGNNGIKGAK